MGMSAGVLLRAAVTRLPVEGSLMIDVLVLQGTPACAAGGVSQGQVGTRPPWPGAPLSSRSRSPRREHHAEHARHELAAPGALHVHGALHFHQHLGGFAALRDGNRLQGGFGHRATWKTAEPTRRSRFAQAYSSLFLFLVQADSWRWKATPLPPHRPGRVWHSRCNRSIRSAQRQCWRYPPTPVPAGSAPTGAGYRS